MDNYSEINKTLWNHKTGLHIESDFYDVPGFLKGKSSLQEIELALLGNVQDKKILHLQCHFGQDTLSLARMGANVTGVDISDKAIEKAKDYTLQLGLNATFICSDVLQIDQHLQDPFDLIFTSYGTIGWLPSLERWGQLISRFLRPGGQFIIVEFHPVIWMLNEEFQHLKYSYFNTKTFYEEYTNSYTGEAVHEKVMGYSWNHPLADVFKALINNDLAIKIFQEYDYSPYDCFANTVAVEKGFQIKGFEGKLPMVYSIVAER